MVGVHRLRVYNKSMSENQIKGVLADVLTCILSRLSAEHGKIFIRIYNAVTNWYCYLFYVII